ncbi:MAG: HEAT repeat domain-containing protein [Minicystis sp.]
MAAEEGSLVPKPEADAEAFATAKRQADEGLVGGASHAALLQGFRADDVHARNTAMGKMAALLRLHPEEAAKTREAVLHGDLDLEGKQRLVGALGAAGTKEARGALASVLGSEDAPVAVRANAAASLGLSASPTSEDVEALVKGSSSADAEVANASTLGLGNLAKRMNEASSGDPADVIAKLVERIHAATTDEERALCLNALGNTGDARALPVIEEYLAATDTTLRATAVKALRFFAGDEADQALRMGLQNPSPQVQLAAAAALSFRAITPLLPTIEAIMKSDASEDLRLALVKSMWSRRKQDAGVMAVLTWTAAHDPSEKVRDAASKALAS